MHTAHLPSYTRMHPMSPPQTDEDAHLKAYNAAFSELNLRFRWGMDTLHWLDALDCNTDRARIAKYLEVCQPHLLKAYDIDFLSQLICSKQNEHYRNFGEPASVA
ncbi:hypothetical protein EDC26_1216 [Paralcaligenes ureilyticus]|uniref:Uncharacterized protein n=2 Tax=Paralcaligenes ureilyticus TaxID=627131 RepID=A0A4V2UX35_9BURK|nr:hypothetical protein EDC26_1216 [Paralcaligenes ureilyticus]